MRAVEGSPGVGAGAGVVSDLLLGSAVLIKNTTGAAAVAVLLSGGSSDGEARSYGALLSGGSRDAAVCDKLG